MACGPGLVQFAFDTANPEAISWAERNAAKLVKDLSTDAKATIRAVVQRGISEGISPVDTARLLRSTVGLTKPHAQAVMNLRARLIADGAKNIEQKVVKYAAKLNRSRALTIARTETMRAGNQGQQQLWQQAQEKGYLTGNEKRVWVTADPCDICAPMEGKKATLKDGFPEGDPPLHPNCKCSTGLVG